MTTLTDQVVDIIRTKAPGVVTAKGDRDMVTEVDYAVEQAVRDFLTRETPEIAFLGEEEGLTHTGSGLMWALDPVDGTANFLHGIPLCAVSLGLIDKNIPTLGVIDLPFLDTRYTAVEGTGARANGAEINASHTRDLDAAIVSIGDYAVGTGAQERNRPRLALTHELAARVQRVRMFGSAAIEMNVNSAAPPITKQCVLIPAGLWRDSRSIPMKNPQTSESPMRIKNPIS